MVRSQRLVRKVRRRAGKGVSRFPRVTYALALLVNSSTPSQNAVKLQASGFAFKTPDDADKREGANAHGHWLPRVRCAGKHTGPLPGPEHVKERWDGGTRCTHAYVKEKVWLVTSVHNDGDMKKSG